MARPRASLASLPLASKTASAAPANGNGGKKDDRVSLVARITAAERKAFRQIALNRDTTSQALIEELVRDFITREG